MRERGRWGHRLYSPFVVYCKNAPVHSERVQGTNYEHMNNHVSALRTGRYSRNSAKERHLNNKSAKGVTAMYKIDHE